MSQLPLFDVTMDVCMIIITLNKQILVNSKFHIYSYVNNFLSVTYTLKEAYYPYQILEVKIIEENNEILQIKFGNKIIIADDLLLDRATFTQEKITAFV